MLSVNMRKPMIWLG